MLWAETPPLAQIYQDGDQGFLYNGVLKLFAATGLALLNDPVDDVGAVANLAVAAGAFGHNFAGGHFCQDCRDGGGANVNGSGVEPGVLGPGDVQDGETVFCQEALNADLKTVLTQRLSQFDHHVVGNVYLLHTGGLLNGPG